MTAIHSLWCNKCDVMNDSNNAVIAFAFLLLNVWGVPFFKSWISSRLLQVKLHSIFASFALIAYFPPRRTDVATRRQCKSLSHARHVSVPHFCHFSLCLFLCFSSNPPLLSFPCKLIEVRCIALHSGDSINSKLISQTDEFHKKHY